jgi:imidazole glycerol-phosphate synthase subunit HisH
LVIGKKVPILGVCVGMQMLASGSDEGKLPGLNWVPGWVRAFRKNPSLGALPMPHMGWNVVNARAGHPCFKDFDPEPRFYFLHSYYFDCEDETHSAASAHYGIDFDCAISNGNIHGVQYHPEKSHRFGMRFLQNFAKL